MSLGYLCPVCSSSTSFLGNQLGRLDGREFSVRRCNSCQFACVENYRTDFENIYNEAYYRGAGADPSVDYLYEISNTSTTLRNYEWSGILKIYKKLCRNGARWLDFGCGAGGLVNFAIERGIDAMGFEEGWAADAGKLAGIPILCSTELEQYVGNFDFITAVEVLEHIPKPVEALSIIRKLLKPGGILFVTTGNARPWRKNLLDWDYTKCPDVHVSFYEPQTLAYCLNLAGFEAKYFSSFEGFVDIIKFKVLKTFGAKDKSRLIDWLPWEIISRLVDARHQVSRQPYGVAIERR